MTKLKVCRLPRDDNGRHLIRLNHKYREAIQRYGIAKITIKGRSEKVLILGHDEEDNIYIPLDIRNDFKVYVGEDINIKLSKVGVVGKLQWYLKAKDPAIYIPAWIAIVGLTLALPSFFIDVVIPVVNILCSLYQN